MIFYSEVLEMNKVIVTGGLAFILLIASSAGRADEAKLIWLGHAAFLYRLPSGSNILTDPWVTNPKAPKSFTLSNKYEAPLIASYELTTIAKNKGV
jgi:hypothetical protein